ncbi:MAG: mercury(II) reductase [Nitrospirae bacterium]|nr:mercury(II) reductase [Nitrospirota bacterium]
MKYDLLIIGGGSAAFAAALKAAGIGNKKIGIIEYGPIGGTCVNRGCIPSKSLLRAGEILYYGTRPRYKGITLKGTIDLSEIVRQKDSLVKELRKKKYLDILRAVPQIELIRGKAEFVASDEVRIGKKRISAEKFIIATGARPAVPAIPGIEKVPSLTSTEALNLTKIPGSITIIGGRFTALEFAQIFRHFGSEVTVLQRSGRIVPEEEEDISEEMKNLLIGEGIRVYTGVKIMGFDRRKDKIYTHAEISGKSRRIASDSLMMATGITPNTDLNLEIAGVKLDDRGFLIVNDSVRTTADHIWAAGDVTGKMPLVTVAGYQGAIAGENAVAGSQKTADYVTVPHTIFTSPQIASVGLTEREAEAKYIKCICRELPMKYVPRAKAVHDTRGLIKMVAEAETGRVLGIHILSHEASEVIHQGVLILRNRMTVQEVAEKIDVYPTMSEMIKLCAQSFFRDIEMLSCCAE